MYFNCNISFFFYNNIFKKIYKYINYKIKNKKINLKKNIEEISHIFDTIFGFLERSL